MSKKALVTAVSSAVEAITDYGAGIRLRASRTTVADIAHAVKKLIDDDNYRASANRLAAAFAAYDAARLFSELLETHRA